MMMLILGGSGSGKSSYAEEMAVSISSDTIMKKYYLATMQIIDEEGHKKVERHRKLRSNKGFLTIEQPIEIEKSIQKMETGKKTIVLECISNLVANEMFSEKKRESKSYIEVIIKGIEKIKENTTNLIVVSNNVFEDGIAYDKDIMDYLAVIGSVNQRLAVMADSVVEVVAGIPIVIKMQEEREIINKNK